jgi:hypothetical protein
VNAVVSINTIFELAQNVRLWRNAELPRCPRSGRDQMQSAHKIRQPNQADPRAIADLFRLVHESPGTGRRALAGGRGSMRNPICRVGRRRDARASAPHAEPYPAAESRGISTKPIREGG